MSYLHKIYDTINIKNSRVGIGTTSPSENLHVEGAINVSKLTNTKGFIDFSSVSFSNVNNIVASGTITASNLNIIGDLTVLNTTTSNTEQMVITNAGTGPALKVTQTGVGAAFSVAEFYDNEEGLALKIADTGLIGIGTATPASRFHIYTGTGNAISLVQATSTNAAQVQMINAAGTTRVGPTANNTVEFMTTAAQPVIFGTNSTGYFSINSSGNVGVGTTNASYALDVRGTSISLAAPVYIKNGNMNIITTSVGAQSYTTTGAHFLGIRATWATTTTDNKLTFRVTAKFHIASDSSAAYRRFESLVTPVNDSGTNKPCDLVVVGTGETSSTDFTGFTNEVIRNGNNAVDIKVSWSTTAQPAVGNLQLQIFANNSLGDFTFTSISG